MFKREKRRLDLIKKQAAEAQKGLIESNKEKQSTIVSLLQRMRAMDDRLSALVPCLYGIDDIKSMASTLDIVDPHNLSFRGDIHDYRHWRDSYINSALTDTSALPNAVSMTMKHMSLIFRAIKVSVEERIDNPSGPFTFGSVEHLLRVKIGDTHHYAYGYTDRLLEQVGMDLDDLSELITKAIYEHHQNDRQQRRSRKQPRV